MYLWDMLFLAAFCSDTSSVSLSGMGILDRICAWRNIQRQGGCVFAIDDATWGVSKWLRNFSSPDGDQCSAPAMCKRWEIDPDWFYVLHVSMVYSL